MYTPWLLPLFLVVCSAFHCPPGCYYWLLHSGEWGRIWQVIHHPSLLQGETQCWCQWLLPPLGVICRLAGTVLNATISIINKDNEWWPSQNILLRKTTCRFPFGHWTIDCNSLDVTIQTISYPSNSSSLKPNKSKARIRGTARALQKSM